MREGSKCMHGTCCQEMCGESPSRERPLYNVIVISLDNAELFLDYEVVVFSRA